MADSGVVAGKETRQFTGKDGRAADRTKGRMDNRTNGETDGTLTCAGCDTWYVARPHRDRIPRRSFHRAVFVAAGTYNVTWGLYAVADPQWLFRFAGMEPMVHPQVFATLGMVIGLYGVLYLEVTRRPEEGWLLAAVGLAGKVFGLVGFVFAVLTNQWPLRAGILVLTNDLIWWVPFGLYLVDAWPCFRDDVVSWLNR